MLCFQCSYNKPLCVLFRPDKALSMVIMRPSDFSRMFVHSTNLLSITFYCSFSGQCGFVSETCPWRLPVTLRRGSLLECTIFKACIGYAIYSELHARFKVVPRTLISPVYLAPEPRVILSRLACGQRLGQPFRGQVGANVPFVARTRVTYILK